jgi:hypothetical protein
MKIGEGKWAEGKVCEVSGLRGRLALVRGVSRR